MPGYGCFPEKSLKAGCPQLGEAAHVPLSDLDWLAGLEPMGLVETRNGKPPP